MSMTLPIDEVDEPLRGYKFAEVRGARHPQVHPSGKFWRRAYDHREPATAVCHRRGHIAPDVECTCGFHAVQDLHTLPDVTEHHEHMVVLEVELGGTVIEHEQGLRGEQQTVLAMRFPDACTRCRRPATHLQPGRVWRSVCADCTGHRAVSRADATAPFGVDVSFTAPAPRRSQRVMEAVRGFSMVVLMLVCTIYATKVSPPPAFMALMGGLVALTLGLAVATAASRLPRQRESLFILQSVTLFLSSMLLIAITP